MQKYGLVAFVILAASFYWFSWRPTKIKKQCFVEKQQAIQKRHDDNLNFYFVPTTGIPNLDEDIDAGRNKPMYVRDLNARLDDYWGEVAFEDCLKENGLD